MAARAKSSLFKQVQVIENTNGLDVNNDGNNNPVFNDGGTTHERRVEMLLIMCLEVLIDIREGEKNPS